jgi:hypothetical protein
VKQPKMPPKTIRARPKSGGAADFERPTTSEGDAGPSTTRTAATTRSPKATKTAPSPAQSKKRKPTGTAGRVGKQPAAKKPRASNIQRELHTLFFKLKKKRRT